jgi:hypothetical protein
LNKLPRIVEATPLEGRWLRLRFTDGLIQDVNLGPVFERGGLFSPIRDDQTVFEQVRVNAESGTVEWPGEIDLDPDVLYGSHEAAVGEPLERRVIETAR